MKTALTLSSIALALLSFGAQAAPLSLYDAYQKALGTDALWQAAKAENEAQQEERNKARAGLLPSIGFSAGRSKNNTDITTASGTSSPNYTSSSDSLVLRQPLVRLQNIAEFRRAGAQGDVANYRLAVEEQQVAVRVAEAFFETLLADDKARYAGFLEKSLETQLDAANKALKSGSGTRIDLEEISARLKVARAARLLAENQLDNARKRLSSLINSPANDLQPMASEKLVRQPLLPETFAAWQEIARNNSPELAAAMKSVEEASLSVDKARAGHLPTVDLIASHSRSESDTISTLSNKVNSNALGVQLNVPLFSGGYTSADTAQARARQEKANAQKLGVERELDNNLLKEFNGVTQGRQQVEALAQAIQASEEALRMTRRGISAGTRSYLDVLISEQQLFNVQIEQARTRYEVALSRIRLLALAGRLNNDEMQQISRSLTDASVAAITRSDGRNQIEAPAASVAPAPAGVPAKPESKAPNAVVVATVRGVASAESKAPPEAAKAKSEAPEPKTILPAKTPAVSAPPPVPVQTSTPAPAPVPAPVPQPMPVAEKTAEKPPLASPSSEPASKGDPLSKSLARASAKGDYMVLVGTYGQEGNAVAILEKLDAISMPTFSQKRANGQISVRVGPFASRDEAIKANKRLQAAGIESVVSPR